MDARSEVRGAVRRTATPTVPPRFPLAGVVAAAVFGLLAGCASTRPPLILVPGNSPKHAVFYQRGTPITKLSRDSVLVLMSCEYQNLFGRRYLRVWLLYFNRSKHEKLIDPLRQVGLISTNLVSLASNSSSPALPHKLLSESERRRQMDLVMTAIGGGLRAAAATLSARNTEARTTGDVSTTTTILDAEDKAAAETRRIGEETQVTQGEINEAYATFEQSLNSGALRKHTVFPGNGVNGFLYLPLLLEEKPFPGSAYKVAWRREDVRHRITLNLPMLADTIAFFPEAGD